MIKKDGIYDIKAPKTGRGLGVEILGIKGNFMYEKKCTKKAKKCLTILYTRVYYSHGGTVMFLTNIENR